MRFISTKLHGAVDYLTGLLLIASPWLFNFDNGEAAQWIPVLIGVSALLYSLLTDYELGAIKMISVPGHLMLDLASGVFLAASPWLFGFSDYVYLPHLVIGLFEIGAALTTQKTPYQQSTNSYQATTGTK